MNVERRGDGRLTSLVLAFLAFLAAPTDVRGLEILLVDAATGRPLRYEREGSPLRRDWKRLSGWPLKGFAVDDVPLEFGEITVEWGKVIEDLGAVLKQPEVSDADFDASSEEKAEAGRGDSSLDTSEFSATTFAENPNARIEIKEQQCFIPARIRSPLTTLKVVAGEHVLFPGGHKFTVTKDGGLVARSSGLRVEDGKLVVRCHRVELRLWDGDGWEITGCQVQLFAAGKQIPLRDRLATLDAFLPSGRYSVVWSGEQRRVGCAFRLAPPELTVEQSPEDVHAEGRQARGGFVLDVRLPGPSAVAAPKAGRALVPIYKRHGRFGRPVLDPFCRVELASASANTRKPFRLTFMVRPEDGGVGLFLRRCFPQPETEWRRLQPVDREARREGAALRGEQSYDLSEAVTGLYYAHAALGKGEPGFDAEYYGDTAFAIHHGEPGSLSLMTCGRQVFVEGETSEVRMALRVAEPAEAVRVSLRLRGPQLDRELLSREVSLAGRREQASVWRLPTARLAEGEYTLVGAAKLSDGRGLYCYPLRFFVKERVRDGDMPFLGGAGSYGAEMPERPWDTGSPFTYYQPTLAVAFDGGTARTHVELADVLQDRARADPRLPPPECFRARRVATVAADYLLRNGVSFMVNAFRLGLQQNLYHTIRPEEEQHSLFVSQSVARFRRYANYAGPFYKAGDHAMPITTVGTGDDYNIRRRLAALKARLDGKHQDLADEHERQLRFYEDWNRVWPGCMASWQAVSDRMDARLIDSIKWCYPWEFGTQARGGTFNGISLRPLKARIGIENTDISLAPLLTPFEVDNYGYGLNDHKKVVWVAGIPRTHAKYANDFSYWPRQVFAILGRGGHGLGFALGAGDGLLTETVLSMRELVRRYGNLFLSLRRDDRVAILRSFAQSALGPGGYSARCHQAYYTLMRARFPAGFVMEQEIDAGALDNLDALVLVSQTVKLPDRTTGAIAKFVGRGGLLLADETTTVELPGLKKLKGVFFDGKLRQKVSGEKVKKIWSYQMDGSSEYKLYYDEVLPFLEPMRDALGERIKTRLLDTPSAHLMTHPLYGGKWAYVTVVNDTFAETEAPMYQVQTLPVRAKLEVLADDRIIYDLLAMEEAKVAESAGRRTIDGDFRRLPGRVFVFATERIRSTRLEVPEAVKGGTKCPVVVSVLDEGGAPVRGAVPLELRIFAPGGEQRFQLYRAAEEGKYAGEFPIAGNELLGEWRIEARELVTGLTASGTLEVVPGKEPSAMQPAPDVLVYDGRDCHRLLKAPSEKTLLLDVTQRDLAPLARAACDRLRELGVNARCEVADPHQIRYHTQRWRPTETDQAREAALRRNELIGRPVTGDDPLLRRPGYEFIPYKNYPPGFIIHRDVILVGMPKTNRFIRELQAKALLYRELQEGFSGPERGVIQHVWTPFTWGHDAIVIGAHDVPGVKKSLDALVELAGAPQGIEPEDAPRLLPHPFARFERPAVRPLPPLQSFASNKTFKEDFVRSNFGEAITGVEVAGDRLLISLNSYGSNLILADTEGNILWARKVTEYDILDTTLSRDGRRIAVKATGRPGGPVQLPDLETGGFRPGSRVFIILDENGEVALKAPLEEDGALDFERQRIFTGWDTRAVAFSLDGALKWNYDDWQNARSLGQHWHRCRPRLVRLSPDRRLLFAGLWGMFVGPGRKKTEESPALLMFDPSTGELKATIEDCMVERMTFSPSGSCMAVVEPERLQADLDPRTEKYRHRYKEGARPVRILSSRGELLRSVPLDPAPELLQVNDDGTVLACSSGPELTLLDLPGGQARHVQFRRAICDLRFSPGCESLAVADQSGLVRLLDRQGRVRWERQVRGAGRLQFDETGENLYVGTHLGRLCRFTRTGELAWQRDLSDRVFLADPADAVRRLRQAPEIRYTRHPAQDRNLLDHLPDTVAVAEAIWPREDFEKAMPDWVRRAGAAALRRNDAHSGQQSLTLTGPLGFPLRISRQRQREAHVLELAARAPRGDNFTIALSGGNNRKLFTQRYEGTGEWQWERFAFKSSPGVSRLTISPPRKGQLLIDDWRLARLGFQGRNVSYITPEEELAKRMTGLDGSAKEGEVTTGKVWVFNEKCWSGGGRRSRGDRSPFPGSLVPMVLANGRAYDTDKPLYKGKTWSRKYEWLAKDNWGSFEFVTPEPCNVHTLAVYESPEPGYATRAGIFQAWMGKKTGWQTLAAFRGNRHAFHVHALTPTKAQRFRYVLIEPGPKDKLFRTTEVEVHADSEEESLEEDFEEDF